MPGSNALTVNEGVRIEIPCVQSALFFEQKIDGECLIPKNWGIRVSASQVCQRKIAEDDLTSTNGLKSQDDIINATGDFSDDVFSDFEVFDADDEADFEEDLAENSADKRLVSLTIPDFSKIGCELSLGRITIGGPVSMMKNPVPGFKKKWNVKTVASMKLKGSLPTAKAAQKPLSALVSLELGSFFAGFAAVGLDAVPDGEPEVRGSLSDVAPGDSASTTPGIVPGTDSFDEVTSGRPDALEAGDVASGGLVCNDENPVPFLGAESFLVQACFVPEPQNDFSFFLGSTLSVSQFSGTKSSQFFSIKTFRPKDCLVNLLNVGLLSKSWGSTTLAFQDSFSAGLSRHKNGIAFCNDALISLSGKGFFFSVGYFCADFGFVTSSGAEIVEPFRAYGSFSASFKACGAKIGVNAACATGILYDEGFPLQLPSGAVSAAGAEKSAAESGAGRSGMAHTSVMCGVSVAQNGFSVVAEGSVKNLCRKDNFSDAVCNFSLKVGFGDGSLQLNTKSPLFFVDAKPVWAVSLNAGGGKQKMISGSVSGKFEGSEFSALKGSMTFLCGIMKLSASASISSAQKITWSLSFNVKI